MTKFIRNAFLSFAFFARRLIYVICYVIDSKLLKRKNCITILCYHSISSNTWKFTVSAKNFRKQIEFLKAEGYEFIRLSDVKEYIEGKKQIQNPSVVLTFDDGYANLIDIAGYIASENIYPTLFVLSDTAHANRKELDNDQPFLSKKQVQKLVEAGWEIGSHTATHSNLITLPQDALEKEIVQSKNMLEKSLKIPISYLSFPKGKYNHEILDIASSGGYQLSVTMDDGYITTATDLMALPRVGVDGTHSPVEFRGAVSPLAIACRQFIKNTRLSLFL